MEAELLLQCRPFRPPNPSRYIYRTAWTTNFSLRAQNVHAPVQGGTHRLHCGGWIPVKYYEYEYAKKPDVARLISRINQHFEDTDKKLMLLVPGRIGTSSPELGVPVVYAEISQFSAICEGGLRKGSRLPPGSFYGSHMFQDMVEADVYYGAINDNSKTRLYRPELLTRYPEVLKDILPGESRELADIVKIHDVSRSGATLTLDAQEGRAVCRIRGEQSRLPER